MADEQVLASLDQELSESVESDETMLEITLVATRIRAALGGIAQMCNLKGEMKIFGSFASGFQSGSSDLDIAYIGPLASGHSSVSVLARFASFFESHLKGYENITKIFKSNVPLLKFTEARSGMEVDLCVNNELGVRNSELLSAYCQYDSRVQSRCESYDKSPKPEIKSCASWKFTIKDESPASSPFQLSLKELNILKDFQRWSERPP